MKNMGDGRRVARVEKEVQQIVASFLITGLRVRLPGLVTVSQVKMPADLRTAKVYVSVMGSKAERDEAIDLLQENAGEIQRKLATELKLRYTPMLTFFPDETTEKVLKIEKILNDLAKEKSAKKE